MIIPTLRARIYKNALAHMRASHVPISVGSTKGRCVIHLVDDLRCLFLRWEENQGVS